MVVHVQVSAPSGPVAGAVAKVQNGLASVYSVGTTDAQGRSDLQVPATVHDSGLRIDAPTGYLSVPDFPVVVSNGCTLTATLEPEEDLTFVRKTRDAVKAVQTNFLNMHDSTGAVQFTPFIVGFGKARQIEWMQNELAHGSTHIVLAVDFNGYGAWSHPDNPQPVNFYTSNRGQDFRVIVLRALHRGLTPIIFLHSGDFYAGDDYFRGVCAWWNAHCADLTDQVIFVNGWETRRKNCGLTADEFNRANTILREVLGQSAILAFHGSPESGLFGSHAPAEENDPWLDDDEPGNWYTHCGSEFEVLLFQTLYADDNDKDEYGDPKWYNRTLDTAERFLPYGTPMPGAEGLHAGNDKLRNGHAEPDWFGRTRERGRPVLVAFEYVAWGYIRGYVSDERVKEVAQKLYSFGFRYFGNGRPD